MNAREFFYLVSRMREAQKDYLATRNQAHLRVARTLETQIDNEIKRVKAIIAEAEAGAQIQ